MDILYCGLNSRIYEPRRREHRDSHEANMMDFNCAANSLNTSIMVKIFIDAFQNG